MTIAADIPDPASSIRQPALPGDLGLSLVISLFIFATCAAAGFPTLADPGGDNDSMLRLVEVRDLLSGQHWYDLSQYRMGPEGGFVMHWSRLVDAPLASLILLASAFGAGPALAESLALTLWPFLLMMGTLAGLIALGRKLGGPHAVFPAAAIGAGALYFIGIFRPGSIDHHNAQLALTVWTIVFLANGHGHRSSSALAGVCAGLMLAIGMETAPYVAIAGASVAVAWLVAGAGAARTTAAFGTGFAGTLAAAFVLAVPPRAWAVPACDAISNVQLTLGTLGGSGLAVMAISPLANSAFRRRLLALLLLAAIFLLVARIAFPQCLGGPFADIDPRLREMWLDRVTEAQSIRSLVRSDWTLLLTYFATPALALIVLGSMMARQGLTRSAAITGAFLFVALLVSCWQLRGSSFAIPLAGVVLAAGVGILRERIGARPASPLGSAALVAAWLLSFNIVWSMGAGFIRAQASQGGGSPIADACSADASFDYLAGLPRGTVLAASDLGSPILANTQHRVLAGPYHRNTAGNLAMIDAMLAEAAAAEAIIRAHKVDYVAVCAGNPETRSFKAQSPEGLMAALAEGRPPRWLALEAPTGGQAVRIYRVVAEDSR